MEQEIWKPIVGHEQSYEVSNLGRVRGIDRDKVHCTGKIVRTHGKILKPRMDVKGYTRVILSIRIDNKPCLKQKTIHRLVAIVHIPNPDNKPFVNHINGVKSDNRVENLEWVTMEENQAHAWRTGLSKTNITKKIIERIKKLYTENVKMKEIATILDISYQSVYGIATGRSWTNEKMYID
jgi:hypothetical protein